MRSHDISRYRHTSIRGSDAWKIDCFANHHRLAQAGNITLPTPRSVRIPTLHSPQYMCQQQLRPMVSKASCVRCLHIKPLVFLPQRHPQRDQLKKHIHQKNTKKRPKRNKSRPVSYHVHHFLALLQLSLGTLDKARLRAHRVVVSRARKRSAQLGDLSRRLVDRHHIPGAHLEKKNP